MNKLWILILGFSALNAMECCDTFDSAILQAALRNDIRWVRALAATTLCNSYSLGAALVVAAQNGNEAIVKFLAPKVEQSKRDTALVAATQQGHTKTAMVLLDAGVSDDAITYVRRLAVQMRYAELLRLFYNYDTFRGKYSFRPIVF